MQNKEVGEREKQRKRKEQQKSKEEYKLIYNDTNNWD